MGTERLNISYFIEKEKKKGRKRIGSKEATPPTPFPRRVTCVIQRRQWGKKREGKKKKRRGKKKRKHGHIGSEFISAAHHANSGTPILLNTLTSKKKKKEKNKEESPARSVQRLYPFDATRPPLTPLS